MRRRDLLAGIFAAMAIGPSMAQGAKPRRIGTLGNLAPHDPIVRELWAAFREGLRERGWIEGENIAIEARWIEGRTDQYKSFAAELIALDPEVIVAFGGSQPTQILKDLTRTIAIVMVGVSHPVEAGFVESLARPGGNVTGLTNQLGDMSLKFGEILRDVVPRLERVAVIWEPDNAGSRLGFRDFERGAPSVGLSTISLPLREDGDVGRAFATLAQAGAQALWVHPTPIANRHRDSIIAFALAQRLPSLTPVNLSMRAGYLISYGPDWPAMYRQAARFVDRLLRGAKPAEIPVEQPTRFVLGINLATAQKLGLSLAPSFLARADEVIE